MTDTTTDHADLIAKLKVHLAELGDGRDLRSDNEKAHYRAAVNATSLTISGLQNPDLEKPERQLAEVLARRDEVLAKRDALASEIEQFRDPLQLAGLARDREYERQQHVRRSLQLLVQGRLLKSPSETFERLIDLDARIAELEHKLDMLRGRLASHVQQAETLLGVGQT